MESKQIWQSKTLWTNLIAIIALVAQTYTGFVIDPEKQVIILGVVNTLLRLITKGEINWGPAGKEGGFARAGLLLALVAGIMALSLLSGCATVPTATDGALSPQSFNDYSSAKAHMDATYAKLAGIPRNDSLTALTFCKSDEASQDPSDVQNCPQCATSVLIMLDDMDKDRADLDSDFKTIQGALLGIQGGPGVITLATMALYSKKKINPTARFSSIYDRFMKNWTSVQHNCWSPTVTKELFKGINKAGASMVHLP